MIGSINGQVLWEYELSNLDTKINTAKAYGPWVLLQISNGTCSPSHFFLPVCCSSIDFRFVTMYAPKLVVGEATKEV